MKPEEVRPFLLGILTSPISCLERHQDEEGEWFFKFYSRGLKITGHGRMFMNHGFNPPKFIRAFWFTASGGYIPKDVWFDCSTDIDDDEILDLCEKNIIKSDGKQFISDYLPWLGGKVETMKKMTWWETIFGRKS